MNPSQKKADRLGEIEHLLLAHPEGLTQSEIARRMSVHRSTIGRYIPSLPKCVYIDDLDGSRWKIDRRAYLVDVRFSLDEAMSIHLATRLLTTRMERQNPHAGAALRKLGGSLDRLAPRISRHLLDSADEIDDPDQRQDPNFLRTLEIITLAWAQERKVQIWYCRENGERSQFVFAPYFIEPYAVGQAVHVIGWHAEKDRLNTLKLERIERIELLNEPYQIPANFSPRELLKDAWGIWYTDTPPQEVILKFSLRVAQRVGETRWHRSEQVTVQEDGSLLWRAQIAEPQEMMPWIRGWGADVEVLKPDWVREKLISEARKLADLYGV